MRSLVIFPVGIVCVMAGVLVIALDIDQMESWKTSISNTNRDSMGDERSNVFLDAGPSSATSVELVLDIEHYDDYDYGFSMAIPAGWRRIVTAEPEVKAVSGLLSGVETGSTLSEGVSPSLDMQILEPGYAVGFESAQQHADDQFADYILVEILPGKFSGLFAADMNDRQSVLIDGRPASYDRLEIKHASTGLTDVDLVIYQAELAGVGYTVGLYAIGEHTSERTMAIAFEVMLQTFRIDRSPFTVS